MHTKEDIERMIDYAREEGRTKEKQEVALSFKKLGVSVDLIAQATGLSPEAIQALQTK